MRGQRPATKYTVYWERADGYNNFCLSKEGARSCCFASASDSTRRNTVTYSCIFIKTVASQQRKKKKTMWWTRTVKAVQVKWIKDVSQVVQIILNLNIYSILSPGPSQISQEYMNERILYASVITLSSITQWTNDCAWRIRRVRLLHEVLEAATTAKMCTITQLSGTSTLFL